MLEKQLYDKERIIHHNKQELSMANKANEEMAEAYMSRMNNQAKQMKIMRGSNDFLMIPTKLAFVSHRILALSHFSMAGTRCIEFGLWGRP